MSRYVRLSVICTVLVLIAPAMESAGATRSWIAGDGNWSNNGNWSPFGVPMSGDVANISFSDGVARTITYDYVGPAVSLNSLTTDLTGSIAQSSTLAMSSNNLHVANE